MEINNFASPEGMKSYLPEQTLELKEVENKILEVFKLWGYNPVMTPILEYYDPLVMGIGQKLKNELFKLIDREGNIMALRPELTAPIARLISSRLKDLFFPLRLSYSAPVFRYGDPQAGKNREIYQTGIELIGQNGALADAELIIIAVESIKNTGLKGLKLDLSHTAYLDGILNKLRLSENEEREIKTLLNLRNLVGLQQYIKKLDKKGVDILLKLPSLRGDENILAEALDLINNDLSQEAIKYLHDIYTYLKDYGVEKFINFDLSLIRGFDYYTGIIFEAFTEKLGYTICGGGRYDNLIARYGEKEIPAVGFAIGIERIQLALKKQGHFFNKEKIDGIIIFNEYNRKDALKIAKKFHEKGLKIILREGEEIDKDVINWAERIRVRNILSLSKLTKDYIEIYKLSDRNKYGLKIEKGWEDKIWG